MYTSERGFPKECMKQILIKNKWTINNLYPYIWTHPFWHLCVSCSDITLAGDHPMNIPTKFLLVCNWFQLAWYFQRRRLKCKSLCTTSPMDAKWWQYLTWPFGSGELTFRRTTRATFMEGLETSHAVVLDKKSKMSLSIRSWISNRNQKIQQLSYD